MAANIGFYTYEELAELLGITDEEAIQLLFADDFPSCCVTGDDGVRVVTRKNLLAWMERHSRTVPGVNDTADYK